MTAHFNPDPSTDPDPPTDPDPSTDPGTVAAAVCMTDIRKAYPHFAVQDLSIRIPVGVVAGLIGPNGAGKSTLMRVMMGLIRPDSGSVRVLDQPISSHEAAAKQDIGYFCDDIRLYAAESLRWHMRLIRSFHRTWDDAYADELLFRFGLIPQQIIKGLSHGQRVKALLLLILARRPKLLLLDEPTDGLDPVARHEVLTELMKVVEDPQRTMIFSSHNTRDVEQICDTITFIDRGRLIATDDRDRYLSHWKRIKLHAEASWSPPAIEGLNLESEFGRLRILTHSRFDNRSADDLRASGAEIESIDRMNLEEIFVSSVQRGRQGVSA